MKRIGDLWGSLRGIIRNHPTFTQIKDLVGAAGLPVERLAHLQQRQSGGASKGQLMDAIDGLVNELDNGNRDKFVSTCTKELLKRYSHLTNKVQAAFNQHGWDINDSLDITPLSKGNNQSSEKSNVKSESNEKKWNKFSFDPLILWNRLNPREKIGAAFISFLGVCILAISNIIVAYIQSQTRHDKQESIIRTEDNSKNLNSGVISTGQQGGITAGTLILPSESRYEKNLACSFHVETMNNLEKLKKLREDFGSKNFTCGNYAFIFDDFNKFGSDFKEYDLTVQSKNFATFLRDVCSLNTKEKISQGIGSGEDVIRLLEMYYGCQKNP